MENQQKIKETFDRYISGTYSKEDLDVLLHYFEKGDCNEILRETIEAQFNKPINEKYHEEINEISIVLRKSLHRQVTPLRRRSVLLRIVASAAALLLIAFATYYLLYQKDHIIESKKYSAILPGSNKAILRLADGRKVTLDSTQNGIVIGSEIRYEDGSEVQNMDEVRSEMLELIIPKGGTYQIALSDGTKVWLNAQSKLIYPRQFNNTNREVMLEGEAYFMVSHNPQWPFIVKTEKEDIQVFGTSFNVNSYQDDPVSKVALVEGSIQVSNKRNDSRIIKPGEQAVNSEDGLYVSKVDLDEVTAWQKGEFMFNYKRLPEVLRIISRWYDFDYEIDPALNETYIWGSLSRKNSIQDVFKMIHMMDENIKIKIVGRRIIMYK